jgi:hypothetical protein
MNRHLPCKTHNQATFATASIRILLQYRPSQQGFFNLSKGQLINPALNLRMIRIDILVGTDLGFNLFNVHPSISNFLGQPQNTVEGTKRANAFLPP